MHRACCRPRASPSDEQGQLRRLLRYVGDALCEVAPMRIHVCNCIADEGPFIIVPWVVQRFNFRCLRQNRRVVAGTEDRREDWRWPRT